jgi:hypothetical protein
VVVTKNEMRARGSFIVAPVLMGASRAPARIPASNHAARSFAAATELTLRPNDLELDCWIARLLLYLYTIIVIEYFSGLREKIDLLDTLLFSSCDQLL